MATRDLEAGSSAVARTMARSLSVVRMAERRPASLKRGVRDTGVLPRGEGRR